MNRLLFAVCKRTVSGMQNLDISVCTSYFGSVLFKSLETYAILSIINL